jgi:hypothetical protein
MSYLGSWKINDYLAIPATTHRFSSGAAYAPTSLTYTIYEDVSTTHLYENVDMVVASPFDGIVGFYLAQVQLTAAGGFEKGKCYTIVLKATVDSVAAIAVHTFQIEAEVDSNTVSDKTGYTAATVSDKTGYALSTAGVSAVQSGLATSTEITALNDLSAAEVNAEVVDAIYTDTYDEPSQGAPPATASLISKVNYLYKSWRNKKTQTTTTRSIYADNGTTVDHKATDSDDGTTFTKGELGTGA